MGGPTISGGGGEGGPIQNRDMLCVRGGREEVEGWINFVLRVHGRRGEEALLGLALGDRPQIWKTTFFIPQTRCRRSYTVAPAARKQR